MRWYMKVAAFHVLSALPGGGWLYRFAQDHITKGLVPTRPGVQQKIDVGLQYWKWLRDHQHTALMNGGTHVDLGTGWHPTIPLLYHSLGVDRQYLLDVVPLFDAKLLMDTTRVVREILTDPHCPIRDQIRRIPEQPILSNEQIPAWLATLGMHYEAPCENAGQTLQGRADVVTSTQALLHADRASLERSFRAVHTALKPGGLFIATIHLKDLYANFDRGITHYNHLKFSPWVWEHVVNSPLMPFNRLKARDYREMLERAGFVLEAFEVEGPTEADLRLLESVRIHKSFSRYTREELAAKHLFFVARKP